MSDHDIKMHKSARLQRAIGHLSLSVKAGERGVTRLADLRQQGSFRMIFPTSPVGSIDAVILNTAGGITGGDTFTIHANAGPNTHLNLTTQAAERIYGAAGHDVGTLGTCLKVEAGARINWLPQETILFDGCRLRRELTVDLDRTATFLMVEPLVFGRISSGETLQTGLFQDRIKITQNGNPIYLDGSQLSGSITQNIAHPAIANGANAMANLVFCAPDANRHLANTRALLPTTAGASLISETVLVVRILASDSYVMRKTLLPILTLLTDNAVPKNWRL